LKTGGMVASSSRGGGGAPQKVRGAEKWA